MLEPLNISDELLEELSAPLRTAGHLFESYATKPSGTEEWLSRIGDAEQIILANTPLPEEAVREAPNLKYINVAFTGTDHIPVEAASKRGIVVSNAAGYSDQGVAEMVLGMSIALLRQFQAADLGARHGGRTADFPGGEVAGRTVGIIGTGKIGTRVAKVFHALGAKLIGYNRSVHPEAEALGLRYCSLEDVFRTADLITVHLPNTPETRRLIGAKEFALMKKSAFFINCARGPIVDSRALCEALQAGSIAGAAVDVFDQEPPLTDEPLLDAPHTLLTPHVAYFTEEAMEKRARIVFRNAVDFVEGREISTRIH